ncbi:signal recognition particle protein [Candidatus Micrarchaeota archaeon]|nr:signal recognition particle protein [Candidatus Micrarchaeota archaeon]
MDLGKGLRQALAKLSGRYVDETAVTELVKDLQRVLIANDVNVRFVLEWTKKIKERTLSEKPIPGVGLREHVVKVVYEELEKFMGQAHEPSLAKQRILLLGLFGVGKSTSAGKIARYYSSKGLKVILVGADVHRPAARAQLQQLADQAHVAFFTLETNDAVAIATAARKLSDQYDVVILDSAGRSAFDEELARELKDVASVFEPDSSFLVVSADAGQVAGKQAKQFHDAVGLTGVLITKMDGSGKGGGALSSVVESGSRICFLGSGEKLQDLRAFDPHAFAASLLGFPDLKELLETAKRVSEEENLEKAWNDGKLDYATFLSQLKAFKKMGPLKSVMQMMGAHDLPDDVMNQSEKKLKAFESAVLSMTLAERNNPALMKESSRQARVAKGAGMKESDVRELVQQFEKTQKMLKDVKKNKGLLNKLSQQFGGKLGG